MQGEEHSAELQREAREALEPARTHEPKSKPDSRPETEQGMEFSR